MAGNRKIRGAGWYPARRLLTGAVAGGLPTRRRFPTCPTILFLLLVCGAFAAGSEPATITGRVFDVYHRPVPGARVVTMDRQTIKGQMRLIPGQSHAIVDKAGMYRLSVPAGRYVLAVLPPPAPLDFATVFPSYLGDNVDAAKAPAVEVRPGELRPFTDFLLLEVESHSLSGQVVGMPKGRGGATVNLSWASGYTEPLRATITGAGARFQFDHVPAGSYVLTASADRKTGSVHVNVSAPAIRDIQIHLHSIAR